MLRRSSLVECVSVLHGTGVYKASIFFFIHQYVHPCLSKNPKYTFYTIKSSHISTWTRVYEVLMYAKEEEESRHIPSITISYIQ
jgi:hypothetical protein